MENRYGPVRMFEQLESHMKSLCIEVQYFKGLLQRYSSEEVQGLIQDVIEDYLSSQELGQEIRRQSRQFLQKYKENFRDKFINHSTSFTKLKQEISNEIAIRTQEKEESFICPNCSQEFETKNGLHNHIKNEEKKKNKSHPIQNENKKYIKTRKSKKNDSSEE